MLYQRHARQLLKFIGSTVSTSKVCLTTSTTNFCFGLVSRKKTRKECKSALLYIETIVDGIYGQGPEWVLGSRNYREPTGWRMAP